MMSIKVYPVYLKDDLGVAYTADKTTIKLWSPNVEEAKINLYKQGDGGDLLAFRWMWYLSPHLALASMQLSPLSSVSQQTLSKSNYNFIYYQTFDKGKKKASIKRM